MNIVIGIIIGALLVLFTPLSIITIVGIGLVALAIYLMPQEALKVIGALLLLWIGFSLIF